MITILVSNSEVPFIETSISAIRQYISNLFGYAFVNFKDQILFNLNVPYGYSPLKRMQFIHGYDDDEETRTDLMQDD